MNFAKFLPYIKYIVNNKTAQSFVKGNVKKRYWTILVAIAMSTGLVVSSDITTEQVGSYVKEYGGSAVTDVFVEPVGDTGLVEDELELPVSGNEYKPAINLPSWSDVKGNGIYERTRDQEHGTCVFESYDILAIEALLLQGLNPVVDGDDTFLDINHSYFSKLYQPRIDSGTIPSQAYQRFSTDGLPIKMTYQDVDSENRKFQDVLAEENNKVYGYKVTAPFSQIASGYGADDFFKAYEAELRKGNKPLWRISMRNDHNVAWFGETTPYIKEEGRNRTGGGHSVAGASQFGIFEYRGEPAVYTYESAIRNGANYHIARISVLRVIMGSWELYEVVDSKSTITPAVEDDPLLTDTIRFGESSDNVGALQDYLINGGYPIMAGSTKFFGNQTKNALNQWQDYHFGNVYNGTVWGPVSRERYDLLQSQ